MGKYYHLLRITSYYPCGSRINGHFTNNELNGTLVANSEMRSRIPVKLTVQNGNFSCNVSSPLYGENILSNNISVALSTEGCKFQFKNTIIVCKLLLKIYVTYMNNVYN